MPEPSPLPPLPVAEIERHLRWRIVSILGFFVVLAVLLAAALLPVLVRPERVAGLPDTPAALEASRLVHGCLAVSAGELRFASALGGESVPGQHPPADLDERLTRARALLEPLRAGRGRGPRAEVALAALDLARHRYADAERRYRSALARAPVYPEARLGLGVALALRAGIERDPLVERGMLLRAIAQFAAVGANDAEYDAALFNRALLLDRVGRRDEARRWATVYLARDAASTWAQRMRELPAAPAD
jgi:tetratricopeptide (TPR) repeat protein